MPEMNDQEKCLMELGETFNMMDLYFNNNNGDKRSEFQQDRLREFNQGTSQSTEDNGNSSTVVTSAENETFFISPAFLLKPLQLENHLGVSTSTCPTGFQPCATYNEGEDTGNCSTATFFSKPVYESNFGANQSNNMKSNVYDHEVFPSSLTEQNEMKTLSSFLNGASDGMCVMEYGSTGGVINSDTRSISNAYISESFEGSDNCFHINNPATTCSVENWGYFLKKRANEVHAIKNADESKTVIVPRRSSQVSDSKRTEHCRNEKFLVPSNDTEPVAGPSRVNTRAQWYFEDDIFICTECGRNFVCENDVVVHYTVHVGDRPFICDTCGKSFLLKKYLTAHLRTHTGEKHYSCDMCKYKCNRKGNLKQHRMTHTGEKPHECCICGKRFNQKNSLNIHLRTHTGEHPYKCGICGTSFPYVTSCKMHQRMCEEKSKCFPSLYEEIFKT